MTDEEKKTIEYLKRHILPYYESKGRIEFMLNDVILNLIEKQSKEIEYWKEQAEGYSDLAHQMKDDFENRDRGE